VRVALAATLALVAPVFGVAAWAWLLTALVAGAVLVGAVEGIAASRKSGS
jgi:hypothetical protein